MSDDVQPIRSVEEARQHVAAVLGDPCIAQAMHYAIGQLGLIDVIHNAMGKDDPHLRDALESHLNDADYGLLHSKDMHLVDPSLPEADRAVIEQIRKDAEDKLLDAAHPWDDAAMPPAPKSCGRGR